MTYFVHTRHPRWLLVVLTLLALPASSAQAQDTPPPSLDLAGGWVGFGDDGIVNEGLLGAAFRWYVHPRLSLGPEVTYIKGTSHSHLMVTGNVTWDLVPPERRVTPFVVVGGGVFQTRNSYLGDTRTFREGAFTAGGGVRTRVSDRVTLGVDARVGWEMHMRVAGVVGLRLGR